MKELIMRGDELGQTMAEYTVVIAVITVAIVTSIGLLSGAIALAYDETVDLISSVA